MTGSRERVAHRAALDHALSLLVESPWSDMLVLRGSRLLSAWAGDLAREPADLDFVVLPDQSVPIDPLDPYPYVSTLDIVQQWPEFADGAGQYEMWNDGDEEFCTYGARANAAPEGLRWDVEPGRDKAISEYEYELAEHIRRQPRAADGVVLDPDGITTDATWAYSADYSYGGSDHEDGTGGEDGSGGIRVVIPWSAPGLAGGQVQVDFAMDERLPEPPVWTRVPLRHGRAREVVVQAPTRGLALAWKLLWLHTDSATDDGPQPKDLYDAVILAEDPLTRLSPRLLRRVMSQRPPMPGELSIDVSLPAPEDWSAFAAGTPTANGSARDWLNRLTTALAEIRPAGAFRVAAEGSDHVRRARPGDDSDRDG